MQGKYSQKCFNLGMIQLRFHYFLTFVKTFKYQH